MDQTLKQQAQQKLAEKMREFFYPRQPFSGKAPHPPTELAIELASQWLVREEKEGAIKILCKGIDVLLASRVGTKGRLDWDEVDTMCFQALSLYLELADESDIGWVERQKEILSYFTNLFWQMPDRIVDEREEKTNCDYYLVCLPCMLKSKELIFSWIVGRWSLSSSYEAEQKNIKAAFDFICTVLTQGRDPKLKTHPDNIRALQSHECGKYPGLYRGTHLPIVDEKRIMLEEDRKMFLKILEEHCRDADLKELRLWVHDDLPEELLKIFRDVLLRSSERSVALQLLKGNVAAAA